MEKKTIVQDMKAFVGGGAFITPTQTAKYLRQSPDKMPDLLEGLEYRRCGKARMFYIPDVAAKIKETAVMS